MGHRFDLMEVINKRSAMETVCQVPEGLSKENLQMNMKGHKNIRSYHLQTTNI